MDKLSLLAVFAHPDDEAYGSAGTFAKYAEEGVHVALISATRGEAGEISDPALATADNLAAVRETELRRACEIMGVGDVRFLDCPDGRVADCDATRTIGAIVAAIRELRPQVVITFDSNGIYGHPDHVAVHRLTMAACDQASEKTAYPEQITAGLAPYSVRKVYFRVIPHWQMIRLADLFRNVRQNLRLPALPMEMFFATDEMVTTEIDIRPYAEIKRRAIAAHRSQIENDEPFAGEPPEDVQDELSQEHYQLWGQMRRAGEDFERDLFAGVR